ncbi:MAG: acetyl-CoA carboxylase biotin carboxyl carrier protein [Flavobacterium sp.]
MDIREIQNLIKFVAKSGATEVKLEMDDFKITIKTTAEGAAEAAYVTHTMPQQMMPSMPVAAPVQAPAPVQATPSAPVVASEESKYITIKSPMIGTMYRKPAPDKAPFVEVGSTISKGDVVCVIEAMKLFNEIESEVSGKIVKVLVDDSSPVEFDQPLFLVDPS